MTFIHKWIDDYLTTSPKVIHIYIKYLLVLLAIKITEIILKCSCLPYLCSALIIYWMPSPESLRPDDNSYEKQVERFCDVVNRAITVGQQLVNAPNDEYLSTELARLSSYIVPESFSHHFPIRVVIAEDANAKVTKDYVNVIDEHPHEFPSNHISRIDAGQIDFQSLERPLEYLTSYDFNLRAEPL